jgi:hypothetical protein
MTTTTTIYDPETQIPLIAYSVIPEPTFEQRCQIKDRFADTCRAETGWAGPVAVDMLDPFS